jgi:hypothetical protein
MRAIVFQLYTAPPKEKRFVRVKSRVDRGSNPPQSTPTYIKRKQANYFARIKVGFAEALDPQRGRGKMLNLNPMIARLTVQICSRAFSAHFSLLHLF